MVRRDREQETHKAKIFSPTDTSSLRIGTQSTVGTQQRVLLMRGAEKEIYVWCGCSAAVSVYPECRWCAWSAEYSGTWGPSLQPGVPMSSYCCTDVLSQKPPTENDTTASTTRTKYGHEYYNILFFFQQIRLNWQKTKRWNQIHTDLCRELLQVQDLQSISWLGSERHQLLPSLHGHNTDLKTVIILARVWNSMCNVDTFN